MPLYYLGHMKTFITSLFILSVTIARGQNVNLHFQYVPLDTIVTELKKQTGLACTLTVKNRKIDSLSVYVIDRSLPEAFQFF